MFPKWEHALGHLREPSRARRPLSLSANLHQQVRQNLRFRSSTAALAASGFRPPTLAVAVVAVGVTVLVAVRMAVLAAIGVTIRRSDFFGLWPATRSMRIGCIGRAIVAGATPAFMAARMPAAS